MRRNTGLRIKGREVLERVRNPVKSELGRFFRPVHKKGANVFFLVYKSLKDR